MTEIRVDQFLPHPPEAVWRALTDPALIAKWWAAADGLVPVVGHRFELDMDRWGRQKCTVLEVDEPRVLAYTFGEGVIDTVLRWTIEAEGTGSRLFLEHSGFDPDSELGPVAFKGMGAGWPHVLPRIAAALASAA